MASVGALKEAVSKTDIYQDMNDYQNMSQLELSKKIPKWKKVRDEIYLDKDNNEIIPPERETLRNIARKDHTMKYARDADPNVAFHMDTIMDHTGHNRLFRKYSPRFWTAYSDYYKKTLLDAEALYLQRKAEIEATTKANMATKLSEEVECDCGGHYSVRNKAKHMTTKKHIKYLSEK
jgi:hypothetical protein